MSIYAYAYVYAFIHLYCVYMSLSLCLSIIYIYTHPYVSLFRSLSLCLVLSRLFSRSRSLLPCFPLLSSLCISLSLSLLPSLSLSFSLSLSLSLPLNIYHFAGTSFRIVGCECIFEKSTCAKGGGCERNTQVDIFKSKLATKLENQH